MKLSTQLCVAAALLWSTQGAVADTDNYEKLSRSISSLAKTVEDLKKTVVVQQDRISSLEQENRSLKQVKSVSAPSQPPKAATGTTSSYLPEIGVIGDIVGTSTQSKEDAEGNDRFSARELELVLGHDIDPYSRLDATIALSDYEEASLEEVYASYWDLPLQSKLRIGRFHDKFGKAAAVHRDSLDTVDEPLVVKHYFGAEGATHSGLDLTAFSPLSGDAFTQQVTFGLLDGGNGEEARLFSPSQRIPLLYGHISNAVDFSDLTNAELGATWINGSSDDDRSREVNVVGVDVTLNHFVTPQNKLKFLGEAFVTHGTRDEASASEELVFSEKDNPWGYYGLIDYRFAERWSAGIRWDSVQPVAFDSQPQRSSEYALSEYLTFFQSEFARWRLQYERIMQTSGETDNRFFLQGTFAIGTHKHSLQ